MTYEQVIAAVRAAPDLSAGVRANIIAALSRVAELLAPVAKTSARVDISVAAKRIEKLSPARLGFKNKNSLAALRSNFWRGLAIAGFTVLPGRHVNELSPPWRALLKLLSEDGQRALSRFAHVASGEGWEPADIETAHLERFRGLISTTCGPTKVKKVLRNTVRTWNAAVGNVPGWPAARLDAGHRPDWYYSLPWSAFPPSLREDVMAYLDRGEADPDRFLDFDPDAPDLKPLRPVTRRAYEADFRRAASILVNVDIKPEEIGSLRDLVKPERARLVLLFLTKRLGRNHGGHIARMAALLLTAGRKWVYWKSRHDPVAAKAIEALQYFFKETKEKSRSMSEKTRTRLAQFKDPRITSLYLDSPNVLLKKAKRLSPGFESACLVRLALYIAISIDTLFRIEDVVSLELSRHFLARGEGARRQVFVQLAADEVKNAVAQNKELRSRTIKLLDVYIKEYRQFHGDPASPWLFPGTADRHWQEARAREALQNYCDRELGIDMAPHVHRSLGGHIMRAGGQALDDVKEMLGHRRLATTAAYYMDEDKEAIAARYHEILDRREKHIEPEVFK
jgi:integrase